MNRGKLILIIICAGIMLLTACRKQVQDKPKGTDREIYLKARKFVKKDPEKSRLMFKEIIHLYPDSVYARRAKIGIADSYFRENDGGSLVLAASEYTEYVGMYPNSPDAIYAKYQVGMCYYNDVKSPGRDQTNTFKAITAFENFLNMFGNTDEAEKARAKIAELREQLSIHYYTIGYYNYKFKAFRGAIQRFKQVMDEYPNFKMNDKLFFFTGKSYFFLRKYDSAISFFQKVITSYPQSRLVKTSKKHIDKINEIKQKNIELKEKKSREEKKRDKLYKKLAKKKGVEKKS